MAARVFRQLFVVAFVVVVSACGGSPTAPPESAPAAQVPRDGLVKIGYVRPAGLICRAPGFCHFKVMITSLKWPEGYEFTGEWLDPQPDGSFARMVRVPSSTWAGWLNIMGLDPWKCEPYVQICDTNATGTGLYIEVEGQRFWLNNGDRQTRFWYEPPLTVKVN